MTLCLTEVCSCRDEQIMSFTNYEGKELNIGFVGVPPKEDNDNINFIQITLSDMGRANDFDAIFISRENLEDADNDQYTKLYIECKLPIVFIGTIKGILPFMNDDISYADAPVTSQYTFATGVFYINGEKVIFEFSDMKENGHSVKASNEEIYVEILTTISDNNLK